jgi:ribonuclease HI
MNPVRIEIWGDGACSGNPGPGGWGCLLRMGTREQELSGGELETTNNRMELMAIIAGFEELNRMIHLAIDAGREPPQCVVEVFSDSQYLIDAFKKNWIAGWRRRDWKKADGGAVANRILWQRLIMAAQPHTVTWTKIKGHAGVELNERMDRLAVEARRAVLRSGAVD